MTADESTSLYDLVGGSAFFEGLVEHFYAGVQADPVMLRLYPIDDMEGAKSRLSMFLIQYWGGPTTYAEVRGHPMLRRRHFPFPIGPLERDHWLQCMMAAIDAMKPPPQVKVELVKYFVPAADAMRNDGLQQFSPPT